MRLVECVPNFSEGRRPAVIEQILDALRGVAGITLLDSSPDSSHNRVVVTYIGDPDAVEEAAFRACAKAAELIDMEQHRGEHPRLGATDVIPFIPLEGVTMLECVAMAKRLAARIASELGIPTYLYAEAATRPERRRLPDIRKGEYEGLKTAISEPERIPDFGPARMHPSAGATVVGARPPLVAFNANLNTSDIKVARAIARAVRESSGGLVSVQAKGVMLEDRNVAQVTMNLLDHAKTPLHRVLELVKVEADRRGAAVTDTEIIGLLPEKALLDSARWYLRVRGFNERQIIERNLGGGGDSHSISAFLDSVAGPSPAPGGGAVAALAGANGAALFTMVANLTLSAPKYADRAPHLTPVAERAHAARTALEKQVAADTAAYETVAAAYKMPRDTAEEKSARSQAIQSGLVGAARVPLRTAQLAAECLADAAALFRHGNPNCKTDVGVGVMMLRTAFHGARLNVEINLESIKDAEQLQSIRADLAAAGERLEAATAAAFAAAAEAGLTLI
ncbi:MAG: glutamate formimidoyltransferase [Chloroflexota bacterium]